MSRGYRVILFAFGLILSSPCHSQKTEGNQPKADKETASQLARIASAIEKQPIATTPDGGCKPGQDDRQSDLCAQWKAADAAAEAAKWSLWMLWISGFGLIVGAGTLFAAWRAAHWAKLAADHTESGANEAKRAADAAERELHNNIRAWIKPGLRPSRPISFTEDGRIQARFDVVLENIGDQVGRNVIAWAGATVEYGDKEREVVLYSLRKRIDQYRNSPKFSGRRTIWPSQQISFGPDIICDAADRFILRVLVYVEYEIEEDQSPRQSWGWFDVFTRNSHSDEMVIIKGANSISPSLQVIRETGFGGAT